MIPQKRATCRTLTNTEENYILSTVVSDSPPIEYCSCLITRLSCLTTTLKDELDEYIVPSKRVLEKVWQLLLIAYRSQLIEKRNSETVNEKGFSSMLNYLLRAWWIYSNFDIIEQKCYGIDLTHGYERDWSKLFTIEQKGDELKTNFKISHHVIANLTYESTIDKRTVVHHQPACDLLHFYANIFCQEVGSPFGCPFLSDYLAQIDKLDDVIDSIKIYLDTLKDINVYHDASAQYTLENLSKLLGCLLFITHEKRVTSTQGVFSSIFRNRAPIIKKLLAEHLFDYMNNKEQDDDNENIGCDIIIYTLQDCTKALFLKNRSLAFNSYVDLQNHITGSLGKFQFNGPTAASTLLIFLHLLSQKTKTPVEESLVDTLNYRITEHFTQIKKPKKKSTLEDTQEDEKLIAHLCKQISKSIC